MVESTVVGQKQCKDLVREFGGASKVPISKVNKMKSIKKEPLKYGYFVIQWKSYSLTSFFLTFKLLKFDKQATILYFIYIKRYKFSGIVM